jgi:hypothetical protein
MNLAELLQQHREDYDIDCTDHYGCSCGAVDPDPGVSPYEDYDRMRRAYRQHLAEVITQWMEGRS